VFVQPQHDHTESVTERATVIAQHDHTEFVTQRTTSMTRVIAKNSASASSLCAFDAAVDVRDAW